MEKVEYKYKLNEKVFYVDMIQIPTFKKCDVCLGEGNLSRKDESTIVCYKCNGVKEITDSGSLKYVVKEGIIKFINITIKECSCFPYTFVEYQLENEKKTFHEANLYSIEEEAEQNIPRNCYMGYGKI